MDINVTDIQIGDWFRHRYTIDNREITRTFRVSRIEDELKKYYVWGDGFGRICYPERLEPIPITPEILEKNGFECRGAWMIPGEDFGLRQVGNSWGVLPYYADYNALTLCHIAYLHELQHLLHLCLIDKEIIL